MTDVTPVAPDDSEQTSGLAVPVAQALPVDPVYTSEATMPAAPLPAEPYPATPTAPAEPVDETPASTEPAAPVTPAVDTPVAATPAEPEIADVTLALGDQTVVVPVAQKYGLFERIVHKVEDIFGDSSAPTMVNGKSVVGHKLNAEGSAYEPDPDYVAPAAVTSDLFDRIGAAFQNEGQRMVIEELARMLGADEDDTTALPEGMDPAKSVASQRADAAGSL